MKFIDSQVKHDKNDDKLHKKKSNRNDDMNDKINKYNTVTEVQVSDLDTSTEIEDNDSSAMWESFFCIRIRLAYKHISKCFSFPSQKLHQLLSKI